MSRCDELARLRAQDTDRDRPEGEGELVTAIVRPVGGARRTFAAFVADHANH